LSLTKQAAISQWAETGKTESVRQIDTSSTVSAWKRGTSIDVGFANGSGKSRRTNTAVATSGLFDTSAIVLAWKAAAFIDIRFT
jgi:hypothetical protein